MAFDYDTKRIGIAVTDSLKIIVPALHTILSKEIWSYLEKYLEIEQVKKFIAGKSLQLNGSSSQSAQLVIGFNSKFKNTCPQLPILEIGERLTFIMDSAVIAKAEMIKAKRQDNL